MPDQTPLTEAELDQIRSDYDGVDEYDAVPRLLSEVDQLRARADLHREQSKLSFAQFEQVRAELAEAPSRRDLLVAEEIMRAAQLAQSKAEAERDALAAKLDAANARIAELEELKCSVCGLRVAHLNANGFVIGWGCANGDNCKDDRLVQARAAGWDEGYKSGVDDERTSADNVGIAGFGMKVNPARVNPYRSAAPDSPRPPAEAAGDGSGADSRPETRTGVPEKPSEAHACEVPDVDGWTLHSRPGGLVLSHDSDADMPMLRTLGTFSIPIRDVLAFIADQEDTDEH